MAKTMTSAVTVLFCSLALLLAISVDARVSDDFYKTSCPQAESVLSKSLSDELDKNLKDAAGLIRMAFHDCFVAGCDASVLLDEVGTEKTAEVNEHLRGFEVIDAAKTAVEAVCPGVVSCADILAYGAREGVLKLNGTGWVVQGGRKDGFVSTAENAESELPPPTFRVTQLINSFARKGLNPAQMVILSGSHTVGVGHCDKFIERLYNFNATHFTDPTLNATLAAQLKEQCPQATFNTTIEIFMDTITPGEFDTNYYVGLTRQNGLFTSDQSLFEDSRTRPIVRALLNKPRFDKAFGDAMRAMGRVGVKSGSSGEIRLNCRKVNSVDLANA